MIGPGNVPNIQGIMFDLVKKVLFGVFRQKEDVVMAAHEFLPSEDAELVHPDEMVDYFEVSVVNRHQYILVNTHKK